MKWVLKKCEIKDLAEIPPEVTSMRILYAEIIAFVVNFMQGRI